MWNILGRELTPYAVSIWIAGILALAVFLLEGRKLKPAALAWTAGLGIVLGLMGARLYYVLARLELFLDLGLSNFFAAEEPEYVSWGAVSGAAFWGAVGGVSLGALLAGKITGTRVSALLDALAPSAALGIAISRFGEFSIGEGIGPEVSEEALQFFPLAVMNEWEEWNYALFILEGLVGLIIFALLMTRGRRVTGGYRARMFLILYSSAQIVLEAMRRDNYLRWLFVRVSQLASALVLLGLVIFGLIRWTRRTKADGRGAGWLAGKALLDLLVLVLVFYAALLIYWMLAVRTPLEMNSALWWNLICSGWPVAAAALAVLAVLGFLQRRGEGVPSGQRMAGHTAVFLLPVIIIIALEFGVDKSADLSVGVAYLLEALCCVTMGTMTWRIAMKN